MVVAEISVIILPGKPTLAEVFVLYWFAYLAAFDTAMPSWHRKAAKAISYDVSPPGT